MSLKWEASQHGYKATRLRWLGMRNVSATIKHGSYNRWHGTPKQSAGQIWPQRQRRHWSWGAGHCLSSLGSSWLGLLRTCRVRGIGMSQSKAHYHKQLCSGVNIHVCLPNRSERPCLIEGKPLEWGQWSQKAIKRLFDGGAQASWAQRCLKVAIAVWISTCRCSTQIPTVQ